MIAPFLLRNAVPIGAILAIIFCFFMVHASGVKQAEERAKLQETQRELSLSKAMLSAERTARTQDTALAAAAQKRLVGLTEQIDELSEYAAKLQDANRECLSRADTDQLRNLWK